MAQSFTDPIGGELYIPAAYPSITVAPNNGGLSTTGVLALIGEAESGPSFSEETELNDNQFAADEVQSVIAKYGSGPVVDAFKAAASAAVDINITTPFSRAVIVKTNIGTKASLALTEEINSVTYPSLVAKLAGAKGNLISATITDDVVQVSPQTGYVSVVPQCDIVTYEITQSGNVSTTVTIPADSTPLTITNLMDNVLGGIGGTQVTGAIPAGTPNLTLGVASYIGTFTLASASWTGVSIGDTLEIPLASQFAGAGNKNIGWWIVTAVSGGVLTATKAGDKTTTGQGFAGRVAGSIVAPEAVALTAVDVAHDNDILVWRSSNFIYSDARTSNQALTIEIAATSVLAGDTDGRNTFRILGTTGRTAWVSTSSVPYVLTGTERAIDINLSRKLDNSSETLTAGGEVAFKMGYTGYSCTVSINSTTMTVVSTKTNISTPVTLTITLADFPTVADLAAYIDAITDFSADPATAVLGNLPSTALDATVWGTESTYYEAASTFGGQACRIKTDAYRLSAVVAGSSLVEFDSEPQGSLPTAISAVTFLANGAKGGTTSARITEAIDALEQTKVNFVVPCFSRDATADVTDGLTDATSTYTIDGINSSVKTHVHKMSGMKTKRNRQAFLSKRDTFSAVSEASANLASHRCMMVFQDVKSAVTGSIVQYQPYLAAALAASMQAGGFYKSIVRKQVNITGAIQAASDWTYNLDSNIENALKSGLNPVKKADEGGFVWASDQTTYGADNKNFYNSAQMVYAGDIVALTTAQRMDRAFVGQSVADVSAAVALGYLDTIMADFFRLKLIAASSDAPLGYKNAKVVITGSVMRVSVEVKIAGSIYFIPIAFYVSEITQSA